MIHIPQMSPLMWLSLFIMFSTMLIMFNYTNYFSFKYSPYLPQKKSSTKSSLNWKW
uniref:ATP synthase complex subunit 8 n=1 Tax=Pseudothericles compressifrons TaxID=1564105 RepID=A0A0N7AY47_9ORTH|nr:ATP synthase F0 subunit 8 [Pseudothericles compressifrons]AJW76359.1 ATP synthase F0 subunit 8 [Pseudothericles compressifrons]